MSRTLRPLAALAMAAMAAVISAGCSSAPAGTGSSGGNSTAATHEKAVKFAECMRNNLLDRWSTEESQPRRERTH
jgi:hypothetical protein